MKQSPMIVMCAGLFAVSMSFAAEPMGLVLSGGGALGAYEVGVWEVLAENGLTNRIAAISGTSIGAINAALFASVGNPETCTRIWETEVGEAFQFNTNFMARLGPDEAAKVDRAYAQMEKNIAADLASEARRLGIKVEDVPSEKVASIRKSCELVAWARLAFQMPKARALIQILSDMGGDGKAEGPLSSDAIHGMILRAMPEKWPDNAPAVYATSIRKTTVDDQPVFSRVSFLLNGETHERRTDILCTSACMPFVLGARDFDSGSYVDGGWERKGGDNVPLRPILEKQHEIKKVIVVYLTDAKRRHQENMKVAAPFGVKLIPIIPSKNLDNWQGVFDASPDTAKRLISLGREDARKALANLSNFRKKTP